jgi:deoxyribodipyrimidine photolyase-related protein
MGEFEKRIARAAPSAEDVAQRRWVYVPYDRLTDRTGPLSEQPPRETGLVMMEALGKARRRPYHKKKLALIVASQRQFALEQAARGVKVIFVFTRGDHAEGLMEAQHRLGQREMTMMRGAERELRLDVERAREQGVRMTEVEDTTWLSTEADFDGVYHPPAKSYLMDRFYRAMRKKTGVLMRDGEPLGGKFSFDAENRRPYRGKPAVPARPSFRPDAITAEAVELVAREFPDSFGALEGFDLPTTDAQARECWEFALRHLLPWFGPYEDAMAMREPDLFHTKISAILNISRVLPREVVADVERAAEEGKIPLASAEGFIRQVLGWREFMRHVHRVTDGYREIDVPVEKSKRALKDAYAGAAPSALDAGRKLPAAYWGTASGLNCLDTVVAQVVREGWSHHITRLMVLSNLAALCGFSPRELADWFWIAYVDAYDWVVETNVLGMGTYADGGVTATKPYVSGAAYIHRMSDYCGSCKYDPKKAVGEGSCPFTALYWSFLERNAARLEGNLRMAMPLTSLRKKPAAERKALRERAELAIRELEETSY